MTFHDDRIPPPPNEDRRPSVDVSPHPEEEEEEEEDSGRRIKEAEEEIPGKTEDGKKIPESGIEVTIRQAAKEDNESLKVLIKETYTRQQLLKPSLLLELTSPRKWPKFAILGYVGFFFTDSLMWSFLLALVLLCARVGWTFLWIWLWPRLMIHDDCLYGGMVEKFRSPSSCVGEPDGKNKGNVRRKRSCLFVAEVKGHGVVGCLGVAPGDCYINPTPTFFQKFAIWILDITPPVAEFKRLMVKESFRSKGVATKLLEAAFQFCLTNKYKSVTLSTFLVWYKARRLYAKLGFDESDIQMFDFSFHGKNLKSR